MQRQPNATLRAANRGFEDAKAFGFYVIDAQTQFISATADISDESLQAVRSELGFADLRRYEGTPPPMLVKHFAEVIPNHAPAFAERWALTAQEELAKMFPILRNPSIPPLQRAKMMDELRIRARVALESDSGGW